MKKIINTSDAPKAIGPYSQAVMAGDFLFVSGQIPLDPQTTEVVSGDISDQTHRVFRNMFAILDEAGLDFEDVVKVTVFLADMDDFARVNEIYAIYFKGDKLPARCAIQVARLPRDVKIEVEAIAYNG